MKFCKEMTSDIQLRIADLKNQGVIERMAWPSPETIPMINGTKATIYSLTIDRLVQWPYDPAYLNDQIDAFFMSNAARSHLLYHFKDGPDTLYIGKSLNGLERSIGHIKGIGSYNQALHKYIVQSKLDNLTVTYYALTLHPDLPNDLIEKTVLACETKLIKKHSPTRFNIQNNV